MEEERSSRGRRTAAHRIITASILMLILASLAMSGVRTEVSETRKKENGVMVKISAAKYEFGDPERTGFGDPVKTDALRSEQSEAADEEAQSDAARTGESNVPANPARNDSANPVRNDSAVTDYSNNSQNSQGHQHSFHAVYRTVHHEAVTHTEQVQTGVDPVYETRSHIICRGCGIQDPSAAHLNHHMEAGENATTYTVYEDILIREDPIYETRTVIDQPAYEESVFDHEECTCGKRR